MLKRRRQSGNTKCTKCKQSTESNWKTLCTNCWVNSKLNFCESNGCDNLSRYKLCADCFYSQIEQKKKENRAAQHKLNKIAPAELATGHYSLKERLFSLVGIERNLPTPFTCVKCDSKYIIKGNRWKCSSCSFNFLNERKLIELHAYGGVKQHLKGEERDEIIQQLIQIKNDAPDVPSC